MGHAERVPRAQLYPDMNGYYSHGDRMSLGVTCIRTKTAVKDEGGGQGKAFGPIGTLRDILYCEIISQ